MGRGGGLREKRSSREGREGASREKPGILIGETREARAGSREQQAGGALTEEAPAAAGRRC